MANCMTCKYSKIDLKHPHFFICENESSEIGGHMISRHFCCKFYEDIISDVKNTGTLFFKQREQLSKLYEEWVCETWVLDCPMNVIGFLTINDLINVDYAIEYINKNKHKLEN